MTSQQISPKNQFIRDNKLLPTDGTPIAEEMEKARKRRVNVKEDKKPSFEASIKDESGKSTISLVPEYPAILPIRTLQLKEKNPSIWNRVNLLMDHTDDLTQIQREKLKVNQFDE